MRAHESGSWAEMQDRTLAQASAVPAPAVVLVIGTLQGGGAERQLSDMANYWAARHWTVILATWSGPDVPDFYALHPHVRRVYLDTGAGRAAAGSRLSMLSSMLTLRKLVSEVRPCAVLSFLTESNLLSIIAGAGLKTRIIVSERVQPALHTSLPRMWRVMRVLLYARADDVVAQTRDAAQWLENRCRLSVRVIPNALRMLPELSGERRPVVVAVGRLTRQKGFDLLLRAFAQIAARYAEWSVAIVGEGEERENLTQLRDELHLDDRVQFVGQTSDVVTWMAHAGLIVQPSRFEGFPNVVLESMGLGAAVISADCRSGPAELIQDGVNGRLVPVEDVNALATAMAELMASPDERARLGQAAYSVRDRYRQDTVMNLWEACLLPQTEHERLPK